MSLRRKGLLGQGPLPKSLSGDKFDSDYELESDEEFAASSESDDEFDDAFLESDNEPEPASSSSPEQKNDDRKFTPHGLEIYYLDYMNKKKEFNAENKKEKIDKENFTLEQTKKLIVFTQRIYLTLHRDPANFPNWSLLTTSAIENGLKESVADIIHDHGAWLLRMQTIYNYPITNEEELTRIFDYAKTIYESYNNQTAIEETLRNKKVAIEIIRNPIGSLRSPEIMNFGQPAPEKKAKKRKKSAAPTPAASTHKKQFTGTPGKRNPKTSITSAEINTIICTNNTTLKESIKDRISGEISLNQNPMGAVLASVDSQNGKPHSSAITTYIKKVVALDATCAALLAPCQDPALPVFVGETAATLAAGNTVNFALKFILNDLLKANASDAVITQFCNLANTNGEYQNFTPLMAAAATGRFENVVLLLTHGAEISALPEGTILRGKDYSRWTALDRAIEKYFTLAENHDNFSTTIQILALQVRKTVEPNTLLNDTLQKHVGYLNQAQLEELGILLLNPNISRELSEQLASNPLQRRRELGVAAFEFSEKIENPRYCSPEENSVLRRSTLTSKAALGTGSSDLLSPSSSPTPSALKSNLRSSSSSSSSSSSRKTTTFSFDTFGDNAGAFPSSSSLSSPAAPAFASPHKRKRAITVPKSSSQSFTREYPALSPQFQPQSVADSISVVEQLQSLIDFEMKKIQTAADTTDSEIERGLQMNLVRQLENMRKAGSSLPEPSPFASSFGMLPLQAPQPLTYMPEVSPLSLNLAGQSALFSPSTSSSSSASSSSSSAASSSLFAQSGRITSASLPPLKHFGPGSTSRATAAPQSFFSLRNRPGLSNEPSSPAMNNASGLDMLYQLTTQSRLSESVKPFGSLPAPEAANAGAKTPATEQDTPGIAVDLQVVATRSVW